MKSPGSLVRLWYIDCICCIIDQRGMKVCMESETSHGLVKDATLAMLCISTMCCCNAESEKHLHNMLRVKHVLTVQDGTSKMSKSAESDLSRINLLDDPKTIQNKIKRAKTDAAEGLEWDNPERPEATNLLGIYSLCTGMSMVLALLPALWVPTVC